MKNLIVLLLIAMIGTFTFTSCSGGWTDEKKAQISSTCADLMKITYSEADATTICDCYANALVEKFPKANFKPEDSETELEACSSGYKTNAELEMEKMMNDTSTMSVDTMAAK